MCNPELGSMTFKVTISHAVKMVMLQLNEATILIAVFFLVTRKEDTSAVHGIVDGKDWVVIS